MSPSNVYCDHFMFEDLIIVFGNTRIFNYNHFFQNVVWYHSNIVEMFCSSLHLNIFKIITLFNVFTYYYTSLNEKINALNV